MPVGSDLIEVFKAYKEFSSENGVFKFSRSGMNLISTFDNYDGSAKFRKLKRNFINKYLEMLKIE